MTTAPVHGAPVITAAETDGTGIPRLEVGEWIETGFDWARANFGVVFEAVKDGINSIAQGVFDVLNAPDALVLVVLLSLLAWGVKNWKLGLLSLAMLAFVVSVEQWENAMLTLSLVLVAAVISLVIGIPLGILAARSDRVSGVVRPVMDLMQTMPAFVWLVPVVMLFSVGQAAGVLATIIFCLPPGVRLTELGIRQVDPEVVEAGHAFGSTQGQILRRIQLPLATQTIMAGVNQVIMLALSMAVIAGLVGAGGLGSAVTSSIGRLDIGLGFEAGLAVVVLAVYLDRVTAAVSESGSEKNGLRGVLTRRKAARKKAAAEASAAQAAPTKTG